jgi:hypothetical protein
MKTLFLSLFLSVFLLSVKAQDVIRTYQIDHSIKPKVADSVKIKLDEDNNAYYQKVVTLDTGITVSLIYVRALEFMAAKNFQQNYGYEQDGKLIFTSTQDLNANPNFQGLENDSPETFTVQFAIVLDMKNGRYRYTIHNVVFFMSTENGNRRQTLYEVYQKSNDKDARRYAREASGRMMRAFEKYIVSLTGELQTYIQNKSAVADAKF